MELTSFSVSGLRCLASTADIPVRRPTILTGANDGGKSTALEALSFLLGGAAPGSTDRTIARVGDDDAPGGLDGDRFAEVRVSGNFQLTGAESVAVDTPEVIQIRRCLRYGQTMYEVLTTACEDVSLRDLEQRSLEDLKDLATRHGLAPEGHAGRRATFLEPLQALSESLPGVQAWVTAAGPLIALLPQLLIFTNDDPESAIRRALLGVYRTALQDEAITEQLAAVEARTRDVLVSEAVKLCEHLRRRCPELADVRIEPQVSFRDQFPTVKIEAGRLPTELVGLDASGAGRRQRIALATWEFTQEILQRTSSEDRSLVVCYDEPDTHLDYGHQRDLATLIRNQAVLPGVRVIVATHSLTLIDRVPIEDVAHLVHHDGRSDVHLLMTDGHLETNVFLANVAAAMGLQTSVLLHERCFVGVEGVTEAQTFPILFRIAMGMPLQSAGIALIAASGNVGALLLARHLAQHGRPVRIIVDEDTFNSHSTKRKFRQDALLSHGIDPSHVHRVGTKELEDLFEDAQWSATANECWPREDGRLWEETDFAALRRQPKFSEAVRSTVGSAAPTTAPEEKPAYLLGLVQRLTKPAEVPRQLREVFNELCRIAE